MIKHWWHILLWFCSMNIYGQISFYADTDAKEIKPNEAVKFTIFLQINGNEYVQESLLQLPDFSKFDIIDDGSTRNTFIDPAKNIAVTQVMYQVLLYPKKAGKIKMGSALVTINGKIYKTEPFDIFVEGRKEPQAQAKITDEVQLRLQPKLKKVYQNQPTVVVLRAYAKNIDYFQKLTDVKLPQEEGVKFYPISKTSNEIEQNDGKLTLSQVLGVYLVFSSKGGNVEIPEISAKVSNAGKTETLNTKKLNLKIENLPPAPSSFKNAVGDFKLRTKVLDEHRLFQLNQPVHISVRLRGVGNLSEIQLPQIKETPNYKVFPPKITKDFRPSHDGLRGEVTADYIIIPKKTGDIQVDLEPFSFFNPKKEIYEELPTKSLSFQVSNEPQSNGNEPDNTIDKMIDNTASRMLDMVQTPTTKAPKQPVKSRLPYWLGALFLSMMVCIVAYILWRKSKNKKALKTNLTPVSEASSSLNLEAEYHQLKEVLETQNYTAFFDGVDQIQAKTRAYLNTTAFNLASEIEKRYGYILADEYRTLWSKIEMEKYAPVKDEERLNQLYYEIINLHNRIIE